MRCRAGEGHFRNRVLICQPLGRPHPSRRQRRRQHRGCGREVGGRHRTEHRERDQKPHPVQHRAGWRSRTSPSKAGAFQKVAVGYDLLGSRVVIRHIIAARPLAVRQRVVEGDLVARVELAVNAVAVASHHLPRGQKQRPQYCSRLRRFVRHLSNSRYWSSGTSYQVRVALS